MKDTKNYFPLQEIGYKGEYCITDQGLIIDTANNRQLQLNKNGSIDLLPKMEKPSTEPLKRSTGRLLEKSMPWTPQRIQRARDGRRLTAGANTTSALTAE